MGNRMEEGLATFMMQILAKTDKRVWGPGNGGDPDNVA
jgi:hypothetical protein